MNLPVQIIADIEEANRGQSRESFWNKVAGRLTASKHHDIYTKTNSVIKASGPVKPQTTPIVAKCFCNYGKITTPPMNWGQDNEKNAFTSFYADEVSKHYVFKAERCGTFLGKINSYRAASPDGIVTCKCYSKCLIEIKYQLAFVTRKSQNLLENMTFSSPMAMEESFHLETINNIPNLFLKWQLQKQCFAIL